MPSARYAIFILPEKSLLSQVSKVDCEPPDRHSTSKKASGKVTPSSGSYAAAVAAAHRKTKTQRLSAFILSGASPPFTPCFFLSIRGRVATLQPQRLKGVLSMWGFAPPYPPRCTINPCGHRLYNMKTDIPILILLIVLGLWMTIFTRRGGRP